MKVLSTQQVRDCDAYTIANEPIASVDLMERAARQLYYWFKEHVDRTLPVSIFCGKGNNGGDGLALARMLLLTGWNVKTFVVEHSDNCSEDFGVNLSRLEKLNTSITYIDSNSEIELQDGVIVDALLGSGLNAPLKGILRDVINQLNVVSLPKVAIDIPTGLYADVVTTKELGEVFKADVTLCFQCPKLSFLVPETGSFVGDFYVLDIGLNESFFNQQESSYYYTEGIELKKPLKFSHKGTNGHALLIAGSKGKMGAGLLSANAALKSGAGLVSVYIPKCGLDPFQSAIAEIMVVQDTGEDNIENIALSSSYSAVGIGPGIGTNEKTKKALFKFLGGFNQPIVLDADALNILSQYNAWNLVPEKSVLTPHPGEFKRMINEEPDSLLIAAQLFATEKNVILVLKGANTAICLPNGEVHFNATGNPGMATAGSGDVLTGIITGLLAQGYTPEHAALSGVYLHGLAGDFSLDHNTIETLTASSILENLHLAFEHGNNLA